MWSFDIKRPKRTLGIRDKQILYRNAGGKCQNPACGRSIDFDEMQVGHKRAASKGGKATFKNCVCLCYRCNKLQGTDTWATFLKKQHVQSDNSQHKAALDDLNMQQLKFLAKKHHIRLKGKVEQLMFETRKIPPSRKQYVNALAKVVSEKDIESELKEMPEKKKRTRKKKSSSLFDWSF